MSNKHNKNDPPKSDARPISGVFAGVRGNATLVIVGLLLSKNIIIGIPIAVMILFASAVFYYSVNSRKKNPEVIGDDGYTIRLEDFKWLKSRTNKN